MICIDNKGLERELTVGYDYLIIEDVEGKKLTKHNGVIAVSFYVIRNNGGKMMAVCKSRFRNADIL